MAGELLLSMIKSRGGNKSDYSDVIYGTVVSASPLQVQMSNNMILPSSLLTTGQAMSNYTTTVLIDGEKKTMTVKNGLQSGDHVAMIRGDGGQTFYIFDKL